MRFRLVAKIIEGVTTDICPSMMHKISKKIYNMQENINLDLCNPTQKRVLISYLSLMAYDFDKVQHASYYHANQIVRYFITRGYCVDVCGLEDQIAYNKLKDSKYDVIFGFGPNFNKMCVQNPEARRVLFVMENNPDVVAEKYQERIEYFKLRHPDIDYNLSDSRMAYFHSDEFKYADSCILMSSEYNSLSFKKYFSDLKLVNCNALINKLYVFDRNTMSNIVPSTRRRFLWFGSRGVIHKGLDILIDAFRQMPEYELCCYGMAVEEKRLFDKLKAPNTHECGRVNVLNQEFIDEIINKHSFVISPSCSEGMSTAVSTCMAHGIIPIITKESGFEDSPCIITLDDFRVETIVDTVKEVASLSDEQVLSLRENCYNYARENLSLQKFDERFAVAMDELLGGSGSVYV